jgi:predicted permease
MTLRELCCRLKGLLRRQDPDPDLEDEIASHLELAKADYLQRGMSEAEAQRCARMKFGSVGAAKEDVWEQRQMPGIDSLLQDAQYAARRMRKSPGFTLLAITTLALGIGLCSVIYTLLAGGVLQPLPGVPEPDRLAMTQAPVPYVWFESFRDRGKGRWTIAACMAPAPLGVALERSAPERIMGALVSPEYFATLEVQPLLGRLFDPRLDVAGGASVAVVTERFWRAHLGADPGAIGRTLRVNGHTVRIIGVGPRNFFGTSGGSFNLPEIFIPVTTDPGITPELRGEVLGRSTKPLFQLLLRLAPGAGLPAAEAWLDAAARALDTQREKKGRLIRLLPAGTLIPMPQDGRILVMTFYGVLMSVILGLACANVGGLMLARGAARGREFAIRLSIGAGRRRLIRQLLTESSILALLGGFAGFAAAKALFGLLARIQTESNPLIASLMSGPDLRVALFTFIISSLTALGFGLLPALAVTRLDLVSVMKADLSTALGRYRRLGLRNAFVVFQVAAAMMLVLIMGFMVLGALYGSKTKPGFDTAPVSFFSVDPARDGLTPSESADVLRQIPERMARLTGVESASLAEQPPLSNTFPGTTVSVPSLRTRAVAMQRVGPGFFATLGATMLRGTDFKDQGLLSGDASGKILPAIINQTAATELFGEADPLGRRLEQDQSTFQIIGVVRYAPRAILMGRPIPILLVPLTAKDLEGGATGGTTVILRARTPIGMAVLRRELAAIDSRLTLFQPQTMPEYLAQLDRAGSMVAAIYSPIGLFGLVLACLGLAGVTAQTAQRRRKEIGIRTALGAQPWQVLRLVMGEGAVMVAIGGSMGFLAAWGFLRVLCAVSAPVAQFVGPVVSNPALTMGVPAFLFALAAIACYVPARRSVSIDPLVALREE